MLDIPSKHPPVAPWHVAGARVWANLLRICNIPRDGVVIEVAPGTSPRIALGLAAQGFRGVAYVVDSDPSVCDQITRIYGEHLPNADVRPIPLRLDAARQRLPSRCDAVLMNHILDDLLLAELAEPDVLAAVFDPTAEFDSQMQLVKSLWQECGRDEACCRRAVERIVSKLHSFVSECGAAVVALGQYASWVHQNHDLTEADEWGVHALHCLTTRVGGSSADAEAMLRASGEDPARWLVSHPSRN